MRGSIRKRGRTYTWYLFVPETRRRASRGSGAGAAIGPSGNARPG